MKAGGLARAKALQAHQLKMQGRHVPVQREHRILWSSLH